MLFKLFVLLCVVYDVLVCVCIECDFVGDIIVGGAFVVFGEILMDGYFVALRVFVLSLVIKFVIVGKNLNKFYLFFVFLCLSIFG